MVSKSEIMKYYILILLIFINQAHAEIYKCEEPNGKISYSDKACPQTSNKEVISYKKHDWTVLLKAKASSNIEITKVKIKAEETIVNYKYSKNQDSNEFIKLTREISNQNVTLLKILPSTLNEMGSAEILVSNKENKLFSKLEKNSKNKNHNKAFKRDAKKHRAP